MELVYVPAGSFMMGKEGHHDGKPVHQVTFREGFYMGKYEVTQAQWKSVMGTNPSHFKGDNLPVEQVSWNDAQEFISKLNESNDGYTYRLPSEAEWEYASRAGTTGEFAGDLNTIAWVDENSGGKTHPVGRKQPNAFSLYDMEGNVGEWCQDVYHSSYDGAPVDGSAWESGGRWESGGLEEQRIHRGGSWYNYGTPSFVFTYRVSHPPDTRENYRGFRIAAVARS